MKKYTKDQFLKAAELGEVSMIDAKHIVSLLDEVIQENGNLSESEVLDIFIDKDKDYFNVVYKKQVLSAMRYFTANYLKKTEKQGEGKLSAEELIKTIKPNRANFEYCGEKGIINGGLYIDIIRIMKLYASQFAPKEISKEEIKKKAEMAAHIEMDLTRRKYISPAQISFRNGFIEGYREHLKK